MNASIDLVGRLVTAVGVTLDLRYRVPFGVARQSDRAHARCVAYVQRRLERDGWHVRREVEITHGLSRGWIDLVAWHPVHRTLLVVEVKTEIHDVGLIERTLGWYERAAQTVAAEAGWRPVTVSRWLLLLATDANDRTLAENAEALRQSFPDRAAALATAQVATSGMALIDPRSRCSRWLIAARVDGRRSPAPYADYRTFVEAAYRR